MRNRTAFKELWKAAKTGFRNQLLIMNILIFTAIVCSRIHHPIATTILLLSPFSFGFLFILYTLSPLIGSTIQIERLRRHAFLIPMPEDVKALIEEMKIKRKIQVKIVPNLFNAFATPSTLYLGKKLVETVSAEEGKSVVAHELDHIKRFPEAILVRTLSFIPIMIVTLGLANSTVLIVPWLSAETISAIATVAVGLSIAAYELLALLPSSWYLEWRLTRQQKDSQGNKTQ